MVVLVLESGTMEVKDLLFIAVKNVDRKKIKKNELLNNCCKIIIWNQEELFY